MLFLGREVADHDRRQRVGALQPHQMAGIEIEIDDVDAGTIGDQVAPVLPLGRSERRGDDLEVDGVVGIGEDEELVAAIGERILHALLARCDETRRRFGVGEIDQPLLGGFVVAAGDHAEAAAGALMQMGEPAGILLLIDQRVVGLLGAEPVPPHLHRPVIVVELHIEEGFCILAPDHAAVGLLDDVVEVFATRPVADADREIFRALGVGAPGLQLVIVRVAAAAELEIFVVLCERIAVEHDMALAAVARHAAEQLVLAALAELAEIGERSVRRRHAGIIFLDAGAHLAHQRLLQALRCGRAGSRCSRSLHPDICGCRDRALWDRAAPPAISRPSARHSRR